MGVSPMLSGMGGVCCSSVRVTAGCTLRTGDTMDVQTVSGLVTQGDISTYVIAD